MYKVLFAVAIGVACVMPPHFCVGQASQTNGTVMVGTWDGVVSYSDDDKPGSKHERTYSQVRIEVSEDPKGGFIWHYTYGKGEKDDDKAVRHIIFDPVAGQVVLQWKGFPKEIYKATGLADFFANGYGVFRIEKVDSYGRKKDFLKGTFVVDGGTWNYYWDASNDGVNYKTSVTFELHRVTQ